MRHNSNSSLSDVIDSKEDSGPRRRDKESKLKSAADEAKDPLHCALCSQVLQCPRNKDYDDFMQAKNLKCAESSDPICKRAAANPTNAAYLARIRKGVDQK